MIFALVFLIFAPFFVGFFALCFMSKRKKTGVLLFHRISKKMPLSLSQISVKQFEIFCEELSFSQKKSVTFSNFSMRNDEVCISFDDGHKSVFTLAFPVLKRYGFTATVFVASAIIDGEKVEDFYSTNEMMNAENLLELSQNGWEIASHGVKHLDFTLLDDKNLREELLFSKEKLQNLTKKNVSALSFPYGSWNERTIKIAKECEYKKFSVYRKHKFADGKNIIPATAIYPFDNKKDMKNKISGEICGLTKLTSIIVPHFAKGTPIFFWNKHYNLNANKTKLT